jgi:hypothetical protein
MHHETRARSTSESRAVECIHVLVLGLAIFMIMFWTQPLPAAPGWQWILVLQSGVDQGFPGFFANEVSAAIRSASPARGRRVLLAKAKVGQRSGVRADKKLVFDFHLYEEVGRIEVCQAARLLVFTGLLRLTQSLGQSRRHLAARHNIAGKCARGWRGRSLLLRFRGSPNSRTGSP